MIYDKRSLYHAVVTNSLLMYRYNWLWWPNRFTADELAAKLLEHGFVKATDFHPTTKQPIKFWAESFDYEAIESKLLTPKEIDRAKRLRLKQKAS